MNDERLLLISDAKTFGSTATATVWILRADVSDIQPWTEHMQVRSLTEQIVDYNSWVETDQGRKLANSLDKDVVLAEGT